MRIFLLSAILFFTTLSFGQTIDIDKGTTRALIIGISQYEDNTDLNFAHRDAEIFADYLKSKAGGSVNPDNIALLTNESATIARIDDEMMKLRNEAQENDLVIFYFSGHGDVETSNIYEKGYLLAYDTPKNNYRRNAIRLEDLNLDTHILSIEKKAKVLIILDACHSGQLAGDNNEGRIQVSREMKELTANEVRILSCKADQKSLEVNDLDGGRGLFSYYLIRGLIGEAESDEDLQVINEEIESYLKKNVNREAKKRGKEQVPEIFGAYDFRLSFVDEEALASLKSQDLNTFTTGDEMLAVVDEGVEKTPVSASENLYETFDLAIEEKKLLFPENESAYHFYNQLLKENPKDKRLPALKSKLVVALQDEAQQAINAYLRGDQFELDRRIYISESADYNRFPAYLEKAAELVGEDYRNYDGIKAKQYYFEGINVRLEAAKSGYTNENLQKALAFQNEAMKWEDRAAYIYNEIGLIHFYLKDFETAKKEYQTAIEIAPTWALPYSNLCGLYLNQKQFDNAKEWGLKGLELKPDLLNPNLNLGLVNENQHNYLKAEEYYRNALKLNWDHFLAFERLAFDYTIIGDYALADHLFKEADIRKKDVFPQIVDNTTSANASVDLPFVSNALESEEYYLNLITQNPFDFDAWYKLGQLYVTEDRKEEAEECFKKVIDIKPDTLWVYHDLGDLYTSWGRYLEAISTYETILEKDNNVASKIWNILEDLKRFDETEEMIKKYGNSKILFDFYSRMLVIFPDPATYWYKRGVLLYNHKEAGYFFWGWRRNTLDTKTISVNWNGVEMEKITKPDFEEWEEFWGERAINDFEKTLDIDPNHPSKVDIHLKLGDMYQLWSVLFQNDVFIESRIRRSRQDSTQMKIYHGFLTMMEKAIENSEKAYELEKLETPNPLPEGTYRFGEPIPQIDPTRQLIDQYLINFEHEKALALLDTLVAKNQLDFENRQKLIRIYILTNQLEKAKSMLDWTFERPFGKIENTTVLQGLYYRLNNQYVEAIESYKLAQQSIPVVIDIDENIIEYRVPKDFESYQYKIATLYSLLNDEKQALKSLENAIENGFRFKKVLAYDPDLENIRSSKNFQKLISKYNLENETAY